MLLEFSWFLMTVTMRWKPAKYVNALTIVVAPTTIVNADVFCRYLAPKIQAHA